MEKDKNKPTFEGDAKELLTMNSEEILEKAFEKPWSAELLQAISTLKIYQTLEDITVLLGDIKEVMEGHHIKR